MAAKQNRSKSRCRSAESVAFARDQSEWTLEGQSIYLQRTQSPRQHFHFDCTPGENCSAEIGFNQRLDHLIVVKFQAVRKTNATIGELTLNEQACTGVRLPH